MRKTLREAFYIGVFDALPVLRDPILLAFLGLISFIPVIFMFVLMPDRNNAVGALVGAIVLTLSFTGILASQSIYFNKHVSRYQDMLVASRVTPFSYALGLTMGTVIISIPALALSYGFLLVSKPVGPVEFLLSLAASLVLWVAMVFLGFAIGSSTKNVRRANSVPQIVSFMLGFIPPVYYPLAAIPEAARPIAMLIPTTDAAQLAKYYFGLVEMSQTEIIFSWIYLALFAVAMAYLTTRKARWVDP